MNPVNEYEPITTTSPKKYSAGGGTLGFKMPSLLKANSVGQPPKSKLSKSQNGQTGISSTTKKEDDFELLWV